MAYSTSANISAEFKDITFSASTAVSDTDVTRFIAEADALIDGLISSRYSVPVTDATGLIILRMISIMLVKSRVLSILSVKTPQDKTKQDPDGATLQKSALDLLSQIKKGSLALGSASLASGAGGLTSYLRDEDIERSFTMEEDAW